MRNQGALKLRGLWGLFSAVLRRIVQWDRLMASTSQKEGQPVFWLAWIVSVAYFSEVMRLLAKLAT